MALVGSWRVRLLSRRVDRLLGRIAHRLRRGSESTLRPGTGAAVARRGEHHDSGDHGSYDCDEDDGAHYEGSLLVPPTYWNLDPGPYSEPRRASTELRFGCASHTHQYAASRAGNDTPTRLVTREPSPFRQQAGLRPTHAPGPSGHDRRRQRRSVSTKHLDLHRSSAVGAPTVAPGYAALLPGIRPQRAPHRDHPQQSPARADQKQTGGNQEKCSSSFQELLLSLDSLRHHQQGKPSCDHEKESNESPPTRALVSTSRRMVIKGVSARRDRGGDLHPATPESWVRIASCICGTVRPTNAAAPHSGRMPSRRILKSNSNTRLLPQLHSARQQSRMPIAIHRRYRKPDKRHMRSP